MHIAQIGTGRVGRPTAYTILCSRLADELTVCDTKPGLAKAFAEELKHVSASLNLDARINYCERDEDVSGADIILISAGKPRVPGVSMSRRDLAIENARIVKYVSEVTASSNRGAKYVVITNPVDAMTMVCKRYSRAEFVIGTGTYVESLRLRSRLAEYFQIPVSEVSGWVGGEHGELATVFWTTVKVYGRPLEEYLKIRGKLIEKNVIEDYVRSITKFIIDNVGGTEYGPAAAFRDIIEAIVKDRRTYFPIDALIRFDEIHEPVYVSVPTKLGQSIGENFYNKLSSEEKVKVLEAAKAIYRTYIEAVSNIDKA